MVDPLFRILTGERLSEGCRGDCVEGRIAMRIVCVHHSEPFLHALVPQGRLYIYIYVNDDLTQRRIVLISPTTPSRTPIPIMTSHTLKLCRKGRPLTHSTPPPFAG